MTVHHLRVPMRRDTLVDALVRLGACGPSLLWLEMQASTMRAEELWNHCTNAAWMNWLMLRMSSFSKTWQGIAHTVWSRPEAERCEMLRSFVHWPDIEAALYRFLDGTPIEKVWEEEDAARSGGRELKDLFAGDDLLGSDDTVTSVRCEHPGCTWSVFVKRELVEVPPEGLPPVLCGRHNPNPQSPPQ